MPCEKNGERIKVSHIQAEEARCRDCMKIIEKYDRLDSYELAFDGGKTIESMFEKMFEEHMRSFHRMIR